MMFIEWFACLTRMGYSYAHDQDQGWQYIHEYHFDHNSAPILFNGHGAVSLTFALQPTVVLDIDHIGGPNVGVKYYIESLLYVNQTDPDVPCKRPSGVDPKDPIIQFVIKYVCPQNFSITKLISEVFDD
jgi:hypothetical protein